MRNPKSAPEALRAKVIEYFGFEKFKQRLAAILGPLLNAEVESRNAKLSRQR